ncbi:MAG: ATP-binding protein [Candidatus Omnitrophota bacterium]
MTLTELKEIIQSLTDSGSDTTHIEVKACREGFPRRIWETISAFANTPGGGVIILGISETSDGIDLTGVKNPTKHQSDLASLCDQMVPPLRSLIEIHKYAGKIFVTAEIPEVSYRDKPCYYKGSGIISGSFIRVADGDRKLTQYEVQGFLDGQGQPLYDIEPVLESVQEDLDNNLVASFLRRIKEKRSKVAQWTDDRILRTYRVITDVDGRPRLTLGGALCLADYPQKFFPGLVMHVLVYPSTGGKQEGDRGERLLDNVKVEGPLVRAVPEAIQVIKRNLQKRTFVKGLFREDVLEYPEIFLREALVNAIGHRDYAPLARGSAVQIKIFPDKVEIASPGGLFGPVTEERLGEHGLQATRNSHLMKLLEDAPVPGEERVLCENRGTGIPAMVAALIRAGMEPPEFCDMRTQFKVVCSNQAIFDKQTLAWLEQYKNLDLSDRQRFALAYLRHKERLTNSTYCRMNDCDSRVAFRELNELARDKVVLQHGRRRWAYYTILEREERLALHKAKRKDRREDILAYLRQHQPVTRRQIQSSLSLSAQAILYWLRRLLKEKKIKSTTMSTRDRKTKYAMSD